MLDIPKNRGAVDCLRVFITVGRTDHCVGTGALGGGDDWPTKAEL